MKLYTEEQVRKAIHIKSNNIDLLTSYDILASLTPIELPSNEEMKMQSIDFTDYPINQISFIVGAKWVIEQIKQQAKP